MLDQPEPEVGHRNPSASRLEETPVCLGRWSWDGGLQGLPLQGEAKRCRWDVSGTVGCGLPTWMGQQVLSLGPSSVRVLALSELLLPARPA